MDTAATRSATERFVAARASASVERIAEFLAPDVAWHTPPSLNVGPFVGRETVAKGLSGRAAGRVLDLDTVVRDTTAIVIDGNVAVVFVVMTAKTLSGDDYQNHYAWVYTWADDLIIAIHEYADTLQSARSGFTKF